MLSCLIITPQIVKATVTIIKPSSADNHIDEASPYSVGGGGIGVGFNSGQRRHGLVKFDLSTIPVGAIINSATLRLVITSTYGGSPGGKTVMVYRVTQDWTENEVTWINAKSGNPWSTPGGVWAPEHLVSTTVNPPSNMVVTWTVTDIVKDWISEGKDNFGFILIPGTLTDPDWVTFWSRENDFSDPENNNPRLTIDWDQPPNPKPRSTPVGGLVIPTNNLEILTPYLSLAGLIMVISTIYVIKRRKN